MEYHLTRTGSLFCFYNKRDIKSLVYETMPFSKRIMFLTCRCFGIQKKEERKNTKGQRNKENRIQLDIFCIFGKLYWTIYDCCIMINESLLDQQFSFWKQKAKETKENKQKNSSQNLHKIKESIISTILYFERFDSFFYCLALCLLCFCFVFVLFLFCF